MLYTLLPNTHIIVYRSITCIDSVEPTKPKLSPSLCNYLYQIKNRIDDCGDAWDNYKKYTNPYEFTNTNVPVKINPCPIINHYRVLIIR